VLKSLNGQRRFSISAHENESALRNDLSDTGETYAVDGRRQRAGTAGGNRKEKFQVFSALKSVSKRTVRAAGNVRFFDFGANAACLAKSREV